MSATVPEQPLSGRQSHAYSHRPSRVAQVFVECNGVDLKGEYVGQTLPKVQGLFKEAMGGCLFIDEAYSLAAGEGGDDGFAKEAVNTLLTETENNATGIFVVLAGYKSKMKKLMMADPGLPRRFPYSVHLSDCTPAEVAQIAVRSLTTRPVPVPMEDGPSSHTTI